MDIRLVNLTKIFADKNSEVRAVDNLDITIPSGKLIALYDCWFVRTYIGPDFFRR